MRVYSIVMERELLYRFFVGRASAAEEERLLEWLDASPRHREELLAERRIYDAMLLHATPARPAAGRSVVLRRLHRVLGYAALLAVIVGAGGFALRQRAWTEACGNTVVVPAGQRVDVTLPDGTRVCMNALSELRYPASFGSRQRRVELVGEAFFDVAHEASRPFVVETYACDVEVLGTKFDVEARPETDEFVAALVEGRVRVTDRSDPAQRVELSPAQRVSRRDGRLVVDRIPEHEEFRWREGLIVFRDATFEELLADFEKYFGVRIEVLRPAVADTRFTGKIRIAEGVDHALAVLQYSADFTFERNETKEVIYIR